MKRNYPRHENESSINFSLSMKQEQLTNDTCCQAAACPKRNDCVRYTNYLRAQAESEVYSLLNPARLSYSEAGCLHLLMERTERWAYGFKALLGTVPIANKSMLRCGAFGQSQATYYRNLNGQRGLNPQEQQLILQAVTQAGGNPNVGFDRYQEQQVFVTGQ